MWRSVLLRRFVFVLAAYLLVAMALAAGIAIVTARWFAAGGPWLPPEFLTFSAIFAGLVLPAAALSLDRVLRPLAPVQEALRGLLPADTTVDEWSALASRIRQLLEQAEAHEREKAALQAEIERLTREVELQSHSLANVSHELRTPLTSIVGYGEILRDEIAASLTADQMENLDTIVRNASVLLNLINNLLDFSRLKAGKLEMTWTSVLIGEVIESALDMVEPQMKAKGLKFVADLPDKPLAVQGSFERLRQVMVNLLGNAVKFTERGEVGVAARQADGSIEIEVWDSGIGIDAAHLPHIFDEFRQADSSVRRKYGGSGLGLAICRSIIASHNGEITATSEPSKGTRMTIRLPG